MPWRPRLGPSAASICADLERASGVAALAGAAREFGVNVLINNAGVSAFGLLENQDWAAIERVLATNLGSADPPDACPAALAQGATASERSSISARPSAALPFAGFVAYSSAKAGLARLFPGLAPRTGRFVGAGDPHRAACDRHVAQQRRGQGA
jgi:NAD(P)-dependent dehydrogenase (short-subunit alcohol dehydrogenase family)